MALSILSNFAANIAQRNLAMAETGASSSVAKISSGSRVLAARDDAAALAIGSRLRAEVAAMQQAGVNAGQAVSMLQIADGAMSKINDTLVRLKSLAVQAGSDQLGSVERGLIDTEFQQLLLEVERIATDTEFNGQSLISGGVISQLVNASDPGTNGVSGISFDSSVQNASVFQYSYNSTGEVLTLTKTAVDGVTTNTATPFAPTNLSGNNLAIAFDASVAADTTFTYSYAQASEQLTVTNTFTGENSTVDITTAFSSAFGSSVNTVTSGSTLDVAFQDLGVTVTLTAGFDRTAALATNTIVSSVATDADGNNINAGAVTGTTAATTGVTATAVDVLQGLNVANRAVYDATAGTLTLTLDASVNDALSLAGGNTITVAGVGDFVFNSGNGAATADGTAQNITLEFDGVDLFTVAQNIDNVTAGDDIITVTLTIGNALENIQTNTAGSDEVVQVDLTNQIDAVAGAAQNLQFDQTVDVSIQQFGVTLTLDKGFDRTNSITTTTGTVTENSLNVASSSFSANAGFLNADVYQALNALGFDSVNGIGYNASTGLLSVQVRETVNAVTIDGVSGLIFDSGLSGSATADLVGTATQTDVAIALADGSVVSLGTLTATYANGQPDGATGLIDIQLGAGVFYNQVNANATVSNFTFKVGTGNFDQDRITLSLNSVNLQALAINGSDVVTSGNADTASTAISSAIDTLNNARANVGAFQNRLEIASANLSIATENTEAARSALLDLNIASEITKFTSQQILIQAGVSMLAQANQIPQNLLRLLQ